MPTGYTQEIYDGTSTSLRDFAFSCARNFGALHRIPADQFEAVPSEYYKTRYEEIAAALAEVQAWDKDQAETAAMQSWEDAIVQYKKAVEEDAAVRARYEGMIAAVEAWKAPEGHRELKNFMLEQLRTSLEFDVREPTQPPANPLSGEEYKWQRIAEYSSKLAYYVEQYKKEQDYCVAANKWIKELTESLEGEASSGRVPSQMPGAENG